MPTGPLSIKEIDDLKNDALIDLFEGKVKVIWDYKEGENKYGPFSFQTMVVTDEDNEEIQVTFKDREEVEKNVRGKTIRLESRKTKNGWHGVTVWDDEYNGKTTRKIKVTPAADVEFGGGGKDREERGREREEPKRQERSRRDDPPSREERRREEPPEREPEPERRSPEEPPQREQRQTVHPVTHARARMAQYAELMIMCNNAAKFVMKEITNTSEEALNQMRTTFFIQGIRENLHTGLKGVTKPKPEEKKETAKTDANEGDPDRTKDDPKYEAPDHEKF